MTTLARLNPPMDWSKTSAQETSQPVTDHSIRDTDAILVAQAVAGKRRAFDFLVVKYQHKVASLISRYTQNPADIHDITQDTFVRAWQALPRFRNDSAFYTWLYRIAVNTAINHVNGRRRQFNETDLNSDRSIEDWLNDRQHADGPEQEQAADELAQVVQYALRELPEDMQTALHHREWEGLSYHAIAEQMQVPVGTVRSRIFRAREAIERRVQAWRDGGDIQ